MKPFDHYFNLFEEGFRNEIIMQMASVTFESNERIIKVGQKVDSVYFIV